VHATDHAVSDASADFIEKPFTEDMLLRAVHEALA
jgi:FixJ family two-component response regulator